MINRVKYLQEELARHDGDLYLIQHVDVVKRGANVAIEFASMRVEAEEAEARVDELLKCCERIGDFLKEEKLTLETLGDKIKQTLIEYDAI